MAGRELLAPGSSPHPVRVLGLVGRRGNSPLGPAPFFGAKSSCPLLLGMAQEWLG